ncbi:uncharacterized protein LOC143287244 [Babylonia areolata]|uniref:uncharacterized protein LOC143287244 n=1 Tax=Babylonia areolata TaxID=304850 RepID=UPI003FD086D7
MESKKNRLKRKPKVSPVAPNESHTHVPAINLIKTHGRNGTTEGADSIVIPDVSPPSLTATESKVKADDTHSAGEAGWQQQGKEEEEDEDLKALAQALLALNRRRMPPLPREALPDLPPYQPCQPVQPELIKGDNTPAGVAPIPHTELPPLPKLCPCRFKRRERQRTGQQHSSAPQKGSTDVPGPLRDSTDVPDPLRGSTDVPAPQRGSSDVPADPSHPGQSDSSHVLFKASAVITSPQQTLIHSSSTRPEPEQKETSISETEWGVPVSSKPEGGGAPRTNFKPTASASGLFSRFSSVSDMGDDVDEFEESSNRHLTASTKGGQRRSAGGKWLVQKRPSDHRLDAGQAAKKMRSSSAACTDISQTPVAKSLFPSRVQPSLSKGRPRLGDRSQPLISSFSSQSSSSSSSSTLPSRMLMTSRKTEGGSLESTSLSSSRDSLQRNTFLDGRAPAVGKLASSSSFVGRPSKDSGTAGVSSTALSQSSSVSRPLLSQTAVGKGGESSGRRGESACKEGNRSDDGGGGGGGGGSVPDEQDGRIKSCPLCQVSFSTVMSQLDIDAHIAACLSVADDDIVW